MNSKKVHTASTIRFRRWSRAGYAVFCSLACSVTIGVLAISVSDKSLQKGNGISMSTDCLFDSDTESPGKSAEIAELEAALQQIQESALLEITFESTAACAQISCHYIINYIINCNG